MNRQYPFELKKMPRYVWAIIHLAARKFLKIDGAQLAGSFAFHAFFSLFPLMILLVTIATAFIDHDRAASAVIAYVENYIPIGSDKQRYIFDTIADVIAERRQAGTVAFFILAWVALRCFTTLISATNRAWGARAYSWWQRPLKGLVLLWITAGVVLLGTGALILVHITNEWLLPATELRFRLYSLGSFIIPLLVMFIGLSLFYRLAPRRPTRLSEVWAAALCTTALLMMAEGLFVIYLKHFATLNAVYGAFGGIIALLLWIYFSGTIFIFGACLCAAQSEVTGQGKGNEKRR